MKAYYIFAALMVCALAACSNKNTQTTAEEATPQEEAVAETVTYTGTLPAADCDGIRYTLTLTYADDAKGTYTLEQVYISDLDPATFNESGDFEKGAEADTHYLRMVTTPAAEGATPETTYYVVTTDSTIVFTGQGLDMPVAPDDYTLKVTK